LRLAAEKEGIVAFRSNDAEWMDVGSIAKLDNARRSAVDPCF